MNGKISTDKLAPAIPDHEVLRVIGRGAYGEIWLARSLTGAARAVKVVHRSTFENERAFNREFEGMSAFEPISRAHDGFVDILHVGRRDAAGFFYYVMELADDQHAGQEIDPVRYSPRTLHTEIAAHRSLPVAGCARIGWLLADALGALHAHGLAHRDIKPSNIIFVGGVPKLADIGLVATSGQQSFVGTEGYVPPEGPGTAQADIYSLGKVLYEISMGKDRLDFPGVATDLDARPDKIQLLQLNEILLKACANDPSKRYASAEALRDDLARLEKGEPMQRRRLARVPLLLALAAIAAAAPFAWKHLRAGTEAGGGPVRGSAVIQTDPPGAMVLLGDRMKNSPAKFDAIEPGKYPLRVMLAGFDPLETHIEIAPGRVAGVPPLRLQRSKGSVQIASQPDGAEFELLRENETPRHGTAPATLRDLPTGIYEVAAKYGGWELRERVEIKRGEIALKTFEFATGKVAVSSEPAGAEIFIDGKPRGKSPLDIELPAGTHGFAARFDGWPEQRQSAAVEKNSTARVRFDFGNGSVKITSAPGGAAVFQGASELGRTPLLLEDVKPGEVAYELRLAGFKPSPVRGAVQPKQQTFLAARLEKRLSPEPGQPWENSLGMKFTPVGEIRFCVWETRVMDWEAFRKAAGRAIDKPDFEQGETHPAVRVNWYDAMEFCKWLTEKERREGWLDEGQSYRLPSDKEWSAAAGLQEEGGATPEQRDGKIKNEFPWGRQWPPPPGAGNYADQSARKQRGPSIDGYNDGFPTTAPAGSFKPNELGIHDLGGNVWEWCLEGYKGDGRGRDWGVLRGGSWANANRNELLSSYRNVVDRSERDVIYGFRCVLVSEPAP